MSNVHQAFPSEEMCITEWPIFQEAIAASPKENKGLDVLRMSGTDGKVSSNQGRRGARQQDNILVFYVVAVDVS